MNEIEYLLREGFAGNVTTLRVMQLLSGLSLEDAARWCLVSPQTFRRWRTDRPANAMACKLLAIRAGYMPWPEWDGWHCRSGLLLPPNWTGRGLSAGEVMAIPFLHQLIAEHRSQDARSAAGRAMHRLRA